MFTELIDRLSHYLLIGLVVLLVGMFITAFACWGEIPWNTLLWCAGSASWGAMAFDALFLMGKDNEED